MKIQSTQTYGVDSIKALIYGEPGAGKTSLAKTLKEPTLVISAEAGLLCLNGSNVDYLDITIDDSGKMLPKEKRISRLADVYKFIDTPECRAKYKNIFIDSITELGTNLVEQLTAEFPDRKDALVMWGEYSKRMRGIIKNFRDLPNYNVIMTAIAEWDKQEDGSRFLGIALNGKISQQLPMYFDEVLYLNVENKEGVLTRKLVTGKSDKLVAKDRSGKLEQFEPADLGLIFSKIKGTKK